MKKVDSLESLLDACKSGDQDQHVLKQSRPYDNGVTTTTTVREFDLSKSTTPVKKRTQANWNESGSPRKKNQKVLKPSNENTKSRLFQLLQTLQSQDIAHERASVVSDSKVKVNISDNLKKEKVNTWTLQMSNGVDSATSSALSEQTGEHQGVDKRKITSADEAFLSMEKNQVEMDVDAISITIRTVDLVKLMPVPLQLAGHPWRMARERIEYFKQFRQTKCFILLTAGPIQLVCWCERSKVIELKSRLHKELHDQDVKFICAYEGHYLSTKKRECCALKLQNALLNCNQQLLRLYVFGQKEPISSSLSSYAELIVNGLGVREKVGSTCNFENCFDFGKSYIPEQSSFCDIWAFDCGSARCKGITSITYPLFGGDVDLSGSVKITIPISNRGKATLKIYPLIVHLLKASAPTWSIIPTTKTTLTKRIGQMDELFQHLVTVQPYELCGYRIEATVFGGCMLEASNCVSELNLLSLSGIDKYIQVNVARFPVKCFHEALYNRMHNAIRDQHILGGAGSNTLLPKEIQIYVALSNQAGFHFGKEWTNKLPSGSLHESWKQCQCSSSISHESHSKLKSSGVVNQELSCDTSVMNVAVKNYQMRCIQALRGHENRVALTQLYDEIFSKIGVSHEKSFQKRLVLLDIFCHVSVKMARHGKYRMRSLKGQFIGGTHNGPLSLVMDVYNSFGGALWRNEVLHKGKEKKEGKQEDSK